MFFIMGIDPRKKELNYNELIICDACGQFGRLRVWMQFMCFSLFFIPLFKWGHEFYVETSCCKTLYRLNPEIGRKLAKGEHVTIKSSDLTMISGPKNHNRYTSEKRCPHCGYTTSEDFQFCPKCGTSF